MKKKALALALCISMAAVMFTGCKTVVQNPTGTTPQVISPEVTIQQTNEQLLVWKNCLKHFQKAFLIYKTTSTTTPK